MKKVNSTNVAALNYDPAKKILEVHFKNGQVYHYSGVSEHTYNTFSNAKSIGSHLHNYIHPAHQLIKKG